MSDKLHNSNQTGIMQQVLNVCRHKEKEFGWKNPSVGLSLTQRITHGKRKKLSLCKTHLCLFVSTLTLSGGDWPHIGFYRQSTVIGILN